MERLEKREVSGILVGNRTSQISLGDRQTERQTEKQTNRDTDRQTERQTEERQTDRDGQTDRQVLEPPNTLVKKISSILRLLSIKVRKLRSFRQLASLWLLESAENNGL